MSKPIAYRVDDAKGITSGEADALLMLVEEVRSDGGRDWKLLSSDGRSGGQLSGPELFAAWMVLAKTVSTLPDLNEGQRGICRQVVRIVLEGVDAAGAALEEDRKRVDEHFKKIKQ